MAALTINKDEDPIAALLNSQAIEKFKAQQQQFQQSLPHYGAPAMGDYQQPYGYAQSLNAMREALIPYLMQMGLYQMRPVNSMLNMGDSILPAEQFAPYSFPIKKAPR
jgi:hypothetical protein